MPGLQTAFFSCDLSLEIQVVQIDLYVYYSIMCINNKSKIITKFQAFLPSKMHDTFRTMVCKKHNSLFSLSKRSLALLTF